MELAILVCLAAADLVISIRANKIEWNYVKSRVEQWRQLVHEWKAFFHKVKN